MPIIRPPPDLGGRHSPEAALAELQLGEIMLQVRRLQRRVFELTWEGNKVPRGAEVLGHSIAWTQHGIVYTEGGKEIGSYTRITEFGGPTGKAHKMHVYMEPPEILGPDGK